MLLEAGGDHQLGVWDISYIVSAIVFVSADNFKLQLDLQLKKSSL
jgi:hypothetical protein